MKQQSIGILLCALLLTTFGHEILNRHHLTHWTSHARHHQVRHHAKGKPNQDQQYCRVVCSPKPDSGNLTISINVNASLLAVQNVSANIVLVVDVNSSLVAIFNLTSTGGYIVDINTKVVVEVKQLWQGKITLEGLLSIIISRGLKTLNDKGEQVHGEQINVTIQLALRVLSSGEYSVSTKEALDVLLEVGNSLVVSLQGILSVIEKLSISVKISLTSLVEKIGGLSSVIKNIKGGVSSIREHNVTLSLEVIFLSKSSFEIAGYIWEQLAGADLINVFGNLNDSISVFRLIADFGGNSTDGVNGIIQVVLQILLIIHHQGPIDKLVEVLVSYFGSKNQNVGRDWNAAVNNLYNLIIKYNLSSRLKFVLELLVKIRQNRFVEQGVNISAIITLLISSKDTDNLQVIAKVLALLRDRISVHVAIVTLLYKLIELLAVDGGINILVIIAGIKVSSKYLSEGGNTLRKILQSIKLQDIQVSNIGNTLRRLDVIGQLIGVLNKSFKSSGCSETVEASLKLSISITIVRRMCDTLVKVWRGISISIQSSHSESNSTEVESSDSNQTNSTRAKHVGGKDHHETDSGSGEDSGSSGGSGGSGGSVGSGGSDGHEGGGGSESSGGSEGNGGNGGSGGNGGNSSGSGESTGNSGNAGGGNGNGNDVSVSGNAGGAVVQDGGSGGNGGNSGQNGEQGENERHKGKGKHRAIGHHLKDKHHKH